MVVESKKPQKQKDERFKKALTLRKYTAIPIDRVGNNHNVAS
jgi:hypothetical protein